MDKLDPLKGIKNVLEDIFGDSDDSFKAINDFKDDIDHKKKKESSLKKFHNSLKQKSYMTGYQKNDSASKDMGLFQIINEENGSDKGIDLLDEIEKTLDSTKQVEKSIDVDNAIEGVKNGIDNLNNLQNLNTQEGEDIENLLNKIKSKYNNVNSLIEESKLTFENVKKNQEELDQLEAGDERNKKKKELEDLKNKLKNDKGTLL